MSLKCLILERIGLQKSKVHVFYHSCTKKAHLGSRGSSIPFFIQDHGCEIIQPDQILVLCDYVGRGTALVVGQEEVTQLVTVQRGAQCGGFGFWTFDGSALPPRKQLQAYFCLEFSFLRHNYTVFLGALVLFKF